MTHYKQIQDITAKLGLVMYLMPSLVFADAKPVATPSKDLSTFTNWPIILLVLIGMIGFIFALAWFAKRFGGLNFSGNREMRVVTSIALGTRERIALIDIKGKQFLIGVTTQQINHLHTFEDAVIPMDDSSNNIKQSDFVTKLQAVLNSGKAKHSESRASTEQYVHNKEQRNNVL